MVWASNKLAYFKELKHEYEHRNTQPPRYYE